MWCFGVCDIQATHFDRPCFTTDLKHPVSICLCTYCILPIESKQINSKKSSCTHVCSAVFELVKLNILILLVCQSCFQSVNLLYNHKICGVCGNALK